MVYNPKELSNPNPRLARAIRYIRQDGFEAELEGWLYALVKFDNFLITAFPTGGRPQALYRTAALPKVHEALDTVYMAGAYQLDPFYELVVNQVPAAAYRMRDISPDAFNRSRYFHSYYRNTTLVDEIAFFCYPCDGWALNVCLGRDAFSQKAFSHAQTDRLKHVAPVVAALCDANWADLENEPTRPVDANEELACALRNKHDISLSPRQTEVALLILRGHSSTSIALRLGISVQTVKVFRRQLYRKCNISSQAELFALLLPLLGP